jgi:hypothetical protein
MGLWNWLRGLFGYKRPITIDDLIDRPPPGRASTMPATSVLERVRDLQGREAQWPEIWDMLNPDGDAEAQRLLVELRGPHMFAPQVALNVLEEACRKVIARNGGADRLEALRAALNLGDPFVRPD